MRPCYLEFGYCHKDARMIGGLESLAGSICPVCGSKLVRVQPPFRCGKCGLQLRAHYYPDRGMRWCTALHAEERALVNAGNRDLKDATMYSTTFPCSNCAREIAHKGVRRVVYVEPYPDEEALWYFRQNNIEVTPFEGVKARAFERVFKPFRLELERRYDLEARGSQEEGG
jgi:deoxycytidylate deaminase